MLEEFDISENDLFSCNCETCVHARMVLIGSLAKYLTDGELAEVTNMRKCTICKIKQRYAPECATWSVNVCAKKIEEFLNDSDLIKV